MARAYCWGFNRFGKLGDNTTTQRNAPVLVDAPGLSFISVSAGGHTCGVTTLLDAYCWGSNSSGQLGNGTTVDELTPSLVSGALIFASVDAGAAHTCGTVAGAVGLSIYCWGFNGEGRLGDGTTITRPTPGLVPGALFFSAVNNGGAHTCAVTPTNEAYCWGPNFLGQLGDGTTIDRLFPVLVSSAGQSISFRLECSRIKPS